MDIKKILVIINPISGYSRSRELPMKLRQSLRSHGFDPHIHITRGPGDGGLWARKYADRFDLVVISGGDGTVCEVVNGLAGSDKPITIFPSGTENLFAKEMGIVPDCEKLIQTIKWGRTVVMDIGQVNDRKFLLISGVGFDAEVLLQLNKFRTGNITHLTYFWPIWRTLFEYHFPPMTIEADGEIIVENARGLMFVSNISRYAVGLRICNDARYDDGLLDVCFYHCTNQITLVKHSWNTVFHKHRQDPRVVYRQAKKIRVTAHEAIPFETDGDPAGNLPAEFSVIPQAVRVILPS
jgi:diacylglycerol kinase (ATP)